MHRTQWTPSRASFGSAGAISSAVTVAAAQLGFLDAIPFVAEYRHDRGGVGTIAVLVIAASLWVILFVLFRLTSGSNERNDMAVVKMRLRQRPPGSVAEECHKKLQKERPGRNTVMRRRLATLAANDIAADGELDHAFSEVSYGPARALVWALPALGFLGTAAEMSKAIGGLASTVGHATDFGRLRDALVSNVIPPLGNAFGMTLLALTASVICHLALTWTNSREQQILLEIEEVTQDVLAGSTVSAAGNQPTTLDGQFSRLISELSATRRALAESTRAVSQMDFEPLRRVAPLAELGPLLQSVDHRMGMIHAELAQDIVIRRQRPASTGDLTP